MNLYFEQASPKKPLIPRPNQSTLRFKIQPCYKNTLHRHTSVWSVSVSWKRIYDCGIHNMGRFPLLYFISCTWWFEIHLNLYLIGDQGTPTHLGSDIHVSRGTRVCNNTLTIPSRFVNFRHVVGELPHVATRNWLHRPSHVPQWGMGNGEWGIPIPLAGKLTSSNLPREILIFEKPKLLPRPRSANRVHSHKET